MVSIRWSLFSRRESDGRGAGATQGKEAPETPRDHFLYTDDEAEDENADKGGGELQMSSSSVRVLDDMQQTHLGYNPLLTTAASALNPQAMDEEQNTRTTSTAHRQSMSVDRAASATALNTRTITGKLRRVKRRQTNPDYRMPLRRELQREAYDSIRVRPSPYALDAMDDGQQQTGQTAEFQIPPVRRSQRHLYHEGAAGKAMGTTSKNPVRSSQRTRPHDAPTETELYGGRREMTGFDYDTGGGSNKVMTDVDGDAAGARKSSESVRTKHQGRSRNQQINASTAPVGQDGLPKPLPKRGRGRPRKQAPHVIGTSTSRSAAQMPGHNEREPTNDTLRPDSDARRGDRLVVTQASTRKPPDASARQFVNSPAKNTRSHRQSQRELKRLELEHAPMIRQGPHERRSGSENIPTESEDQQVIRSRSEMDTYNPSESEDDSEQSKSDEEERPDGKVQRTTPKRLRKQSETSANTSRKRRSPASLSTTPPDTVLDDDDGIRMYGQWQILQDMCSKSLNKIGCDIDKNGKRHNRSKIPLEDADIKKLIILCATAAKLYKDMEKNGNEEDPANTLNEIGHAIDGLCEDNEKFHEKEKTASIYFHLIPDLLLLVRSAIICYAVMDRNKDHVHPGQITITHLEIVAKLINMILQLEVAAKEKYSRPDPTLGVVRPIHNEIIVALRDRILPLFRRRIAKHAYEVDVTDKNEAAEAKRALRRAEEQRREQERKYFRALQMDWQQMHWERIRSEGSSMSISKREHLKPPDATIDEDGNGLTFGRLEVFHPRVGPPPGLVDKAAASPWAKEELVALVEGLKSYAGRGRAGVFVGVFRRYCPPGEPLHRFNVTEIVTTAASLQDQLSKSQAASATGVQEWVKGIPIWTKGAAALGPENEDPIAA